MNEDQSLKEEHHQPKIYEIRIQGHLQDKWAEWFEGLTLTRQDDGTTTMCGPLPDQTALHGILLKIRNMNLKLISVSEEMLESENEM